jgi:hypothetical protein
MDEEKRKTIKPQKIQMNFGQSERNFPKKGFRPDDLCPICHTERLDYNGLLNLVCPVCGLIEGGCFT